MDRFSRTVMGYHGCTPKFAEAILRDEVPVAEWEFSTNPYDWLGQGIYFWEYGPERAAAWGEGGVIGAVIQLGRCLDLTDTRSPPLLLTAYRNLKSLFRQEKRRLPRNRGKRRDLDSLVINTLVAAQREDERFQTIRAPFLEGMPAFPGSGILRESHVPIAVRDRRCILGVFRPTQMEG